MRSKFFQASRSGVSSMIPISRLTRTNCRSISDISIHFDLSMPQSNPLYSELEQYKSARLSLDAKLYNQYIKSVKLHENHQYTEAIIEFQKIVSITAIEKIRDLTPNLIDIIAKSYSQLAEIYQVGTSEDEERALECAKIAHELNPNLEMPPKIISSIHADRAPYPENTESDSFNGTKSSIRSKV